MLRKELARQEVTGLANILRPVPVARVQRTTRDARNKMEERQSRDGGWMGKGGTDGEEPQRAAQ